MARPDLLPLAVPNCPHPMNKTLTVKEERGTVGADRVI